MSETSDCIVFSDAAIKRGDHIIWQHGTFAIPTGSVTAIVGTNGTGKTTMMRAELGLLPLCHGSLTVLGKPAGEMNKRIGYVPQSYVANVDSNLTAEQSVLLGLTGTRFGIHPITKAQKAKALEAMEFTGIADKARYRLSELSGGLRQRVAIAQALVCDPQLLMLDEPLANLDLASQRATVHVLAKLNRELNMTIQVVAHDLNMLLPILTGAVYLLDGHPHYADMHKVLDSDLLTHLYGTQVQVVTTPQGDMFVTPTPDELQDQPQDMHTAAEVAQLHHHEHGNATNGSAAISAENREHQASRPTAHQRTAAQAWRKYRDMSTINFSYDPEWLDTLSAPFMTNAFIAGLCIALAAGVMGYFTIARRSTFAAHALAHIGLPGATGAVLLGLPVSLGMGVFALGGALVIGALGKRVSEREIATGTVLAFATGLGLFFARLSSSASQQMQSILFGSILTITTGQIIGFAVFDVLLLALLAIIYRPLLFSSLDEQVAQAKGVPIGLMNVAFMAIMAGVITIAVPAVGTLLIFALVITPAATANILAGSPFKAMVIASVLCLVSIWAGLVLSAMFPAPPSFIIVTLSTLFWAIAKAVETMRK